MAPTTAGPALAIRSHPAADRGGPFWTSCPEARAQQRVGAGRRSSPGARRAETLAASQVRASCQGCGDVERGPDPGAQGAGRPIAGMETDPEATASQYRRQAEHLRRAVEMIEEARLREQLLSIARQYDAAAGSIEQGLRLQAAVAKP